MSSVCSSSVLAVVLLLAAAAQGSAQGDVARRFQGLDRDGDGRITRQEWKGSAQAFNRHDWNGDGVLSGDEVRPGARRAARQDGPREGFSGGDGDFDDWTAEGFDGLDHNGDGRLTADEWHFDPATFRRVDRDGNGALSRREFLGDFGNGAASTAAPGSDLFSRVDANRDGTIAETEWPGSRSTFDSLDTDGNGRLTRAELSGEPSRATTRGRAYEAGYERGVIEGRAAGREDRERNQGWDLEGQRELEQADSGYERRLGPREEYQAGYRDGFRRAYREGWRAAGPR